MKHRDSSGSATLSVAREIAVLRLDAAGRIVAANLLQQDLPLDARRPMLDVVMRQTHVLKRLLDAIIRVEDDGVGIAPENVERIFELFTRESPGDAADTAPAGSGIGLAVVKRLASLHGGFVEARSPGRGQGSIFLLQLPMRRPRM